MKAAIVVLSDPVHGGEESRARLINALAAAYDFKQRGEEVSVLFQGAGVRWIGELNQPDHPLASLYQAVREKVRGASCECANVFGATETVQKNGVTLLAENPVPGTSGVASLAGLMAEGYQILTF
ncbi:DsrE family protein [Gloeobacter kilaueensis]|uniref:Uncharacterized protein n=1 Tax=Gloeobacter kilaueensis (strain ATCC BAA-2537 / CCAP 1431/1 / ULC 316 / JS1) TaxID=1183438 RepID=U5QLQ6_GLOK1|nr:DsrE family protein [Gloeobacter kilaueensis]AGY59836.1 hypothetical protein GKIL_3590 [Gloeobacter kilaueensis JS1]